MKSSATLLSTVRWARGCLCVLLVFSLGCPAAGPGGDENQYSGIPDHPTAQRMVDGILPFGVHDNIETSRVVASTGLMAAVTMLPDRRVALVFPAADRVGFDLAIGGIDHPWDRRPLSETPVDEVGDVASIAGLDGTVWTVIRGQTTPQAMELIRWTEQGGLEREPIDRPAHSVSFPYNYSCPDLALGLSPDGYFDVVFRQNGAEGQSELHHARRSPSGQWESQLIASSTGDVFDFYYPLQRGKRSIGCQTALAYDESGYPQILTTVVLTTPEGPQMHSAGFLIGGDEQWYPSGEKYFKDGRRQWAGAQWHQDAIFGVDLRAGWHGFLYDGAKILALSGDNNPLYPHGGTWADVGLNSLRAPMPPVQSDLSPVDSYFHSNHHHRLLDSYHHHFIDEHAFGLRLRPDGGVCVAAHPDRWAGVSCSWPHLTYHGEDEVPFWRHTNLEMRSPIFTRGPVNVHAAFCLTRDHRLAACSGGHEIYEGPPRIVDEPIYIVDSSVDSGDYALDTGLWVKLNKSPAELMEAGVRVGVGITPLTHRPANSYLVESLASNDRFLLNVAVQYSDKAPLLANEWYILHIDIYDGEYEYIDPWQFIDNSGRTRVFRVGENGQFFYEPDPRSDEITVGCDDRNEIDEDGVCRRKELLFPTQTSNNSRLNTDIVFDPATANGALPVIYNSNGEVVDEFATPGVFEGLRWDVIDLDVVFEERESYELVYPEGVHDGLGKYLTDAERRYRFETALKSFRFLGSSPAEGESDVSLTAPIILYFNGAVSPTSANTHVLLRSPTGEVPLTFGQGGEAEEGFTIIGQHAKLEPNTEYEIEISEFLQTENEVEWTNQLGVSHFISFTTGDDE